MNALQSVIEIFKDKYYYAQSLEREFNIKNYEWHLGCEVVNYLRMISDEYCMYVFLNDCMYIFGIPVVLDYKDRLRVSLVKEIKR